MLTRSAQIIQQHALSFSFAKKANVRGISGNTVHWSTHLAQGLRVEPVGEAFELDLQGTVGSDGDNLARLANALGTSSPSSVRCFMLN